MKTVKLKTPLDRQSLEELKAGDFVEITGEIYTARDAAHKLMVETLRFGNPLPFNPKGAVIFYAGPAPAPPGRPIGSTGPTTSGRMDIFTPIILDAGVLATIGKGPRSDEVIEAIKKTGSVYLAALGGAGALLSFRIKSAEIIAFPDLGTEALRKLGVMGFPAIVAIDSKGNDLYKLGVARFARS